MSKYLLRLTLRLHVVFSIRFPVNMYLSSLPTTLSVFQRPLHQGDFHLLLIGWGFKESVGNSYFQREYLGQRFRAREKADPVGSRFRWSQWKKRFNLCDWIPCFGSILRSATGLSGLPQSQWKSPVSADNFIFWCEIFNSIYGILEIAGWLAARRTVSPPLLSPRWYETCSFEMIIFSLFFWTSWFQEVPFLQVPWIENGIKTFFYNKTPSLVPRQEQL